MKTDSVVIKKKTSYFEVARDVWGLRDVMVNVYMIRNKDGSWVLVDAGLKTAAPKIRKMASQLFGAYSKPAAIVLTHGHFDHVGSLKRLLEEWDVPVYAHKLELPYLTGESSYPPADPAVGGGVMPLLAPLYPTKPIDVSDNLKTLSNGAIPELQGWTVIHTPGHSPGHISLFRADDRTLIVGDAFVTTKQESMLSIIFQTPYLQGPPSYFTIDWSAAARSVAKLESLQPEVVASGHGKPMRGNVMRERLRKLVNEFRSKAVPKHGRYVNEAAEADEHGITYVPPREYNVNKTAIVLGATALLAAGLYTVYARQKKSKNLIDRWI